MKPEQTMERMISAQMISEPLQWSGFQTRKPIPRRKMTDLISDFHHLMSHAGMTHSRFKFFPHSTPLSS